MASPDHLEILAEGADAWNAWRRSHPEVTPDLSRKWFVGRPLEGIDLHGADLSYSRWSDSLLEGANLSHCSLIESELQGADLDQVDLSGANMHKTDLEEASLRGSNLDSLRAWHSSFTDADLTDATLRGSSLEWCDLSGARLTGADLEGANLTSAHLVQTDLRNAKLTSARVFGVSAWGVQLDGAEQLALEVAKSGEPSVTVDDLEMAQFIYHLLNDAEAQRVFESVTSKGVLILGRFTPERKAVLDRIRVKLRNLGYLPLLFDFDVPADRDVTETVTLLARLARFIIADLTDPASIPKELEAIVPDVVVPVIPLIQGNDRPYSMFRDYWKYDWVLDVHRYQSPDSLIRSFKSKVVAPAERKLTEIGQRGSG